MQSTQQSGVVNGVVGGLLAGAVVAGWFLAADILAGTPLHTPAELGATLFDRAYAGSAANVTLYTLLHFGVFAIVGGVTGWLLAATGTTPGILLGLFFGVCVLNGIHYVGLLITNRELLTVLPWPHVVGANLLAGALFMSFFHRAQGEERPLGLAVLRHHPLIAEGLKVGLIGAIAVAVWFFLIDIVLGSPFRTPAALGSVVFLGAAAPEQVSTAPVVVAAYTVLHLVAFAAFGILFAGIARGIERLPSFAYMALLGAIVLEAISFGTLVVFGQWVLGSVSLWEIGLANLLAVAAMGWRIWHTHPILRQQLKAEGLASAP